MVTSDNLTHDASPIPRMLILEMPEDTPRVTTVTRTMGEPFRPVEQDGGNKGELVKEKQELEEYKSFKSFQEMKNKKEREQSRRMNTKIY